MLIRHAMAGEMPDAFDESDATLRDRAAIGRRVHCGAAIAPVTFNVVFLAMSFAPVLKFHADEKRCF